MSILNKIFKNYVSKKQLKNELEFYKRLELHENKSSDKEYDIITIKSNIIKHPDQVKGAIKKDIKIKLLESLIGEINNNYNEIVEFEIEETMYGMVEITATLLIAKNKVPFVKL